MTESAETYGEQFQAIEQGVKVVEQEKTLQLYLRARSTLQEFLAACESAREMYASGHRDVTIQQEALGKFVNEYSKLFLVLVDPDAQERLLLRAMSPANWLTGQAAEIAPIASAELTLRKVAVVSIECISAPFSGESRLPQWDRRIEEAQAEFDRAAQAWRDLEGNASGRPPIPNQRSDIAGGSRLQGRQNANKTNVAPHNKRTS